MSIWEKAVADAMSPGLISVAQTASLAEAARVMETRRVTGLPVMDASGCLAGMISQTDLIRVRASQQLSHSWTGLPVSEIMSRPALTVTATASLGEAARLMREKHVHRLVVVNDESLPIGILSSSDLVKVLADAAADDLSER